MKPMSTKAIGGAMSVVVKVVGSVGGGVGPEIKDLAALQ